MSDYRLPDAVRIGHVHLTVSDLARAERFYCGILGFSVTQRWGDQALFLATGGYHHHIGLNIWAGRGTTPPPAGHTGLYHVAIVYPSRRALLAAYLRLRAARHPIDGAADHGVSEAIYLQDPDRNGVEMGTRRLDLEACWRRRPIGTPPCRTSAATRRRSGRRSSSRARARRSVSSTRTRASRSRRTTTRRSISGSMRCIYTCDPRTSKG